MTKQIENINKKIDDLEIIFKKEPNNIPIIINLANEFETDIDFFLVDLEKKGVVGLGNRDNLITGNLEGRLEERSDFQFTIDNTPMLLTKVLGLADGGGR